jgi:hypothetical protein
MMPSNIRTLRHTYIYENPNVYYTRPPYGRARLVCV